MCMCVLVAGLCQFKPADIKRFTHTRTDCVFLYLSLLFISWRASFSVVRRYAVGFTQTVVVSSCSFFFLVLTCVRVYFSP